LQKCDFEMLVLRKFGKGAADAFRAGLDVYLDAVNADIETRQAVMQPQFVRLRSD
jgi:hypothetical protein